MLLNIILVLIIILLIYCLFSIRSLNHQNLALFTIVINMSIAIDSLLPDEKKVRMIDKEHNGEL
jgi:uncharacterized membrane protein YfhO